MFSVILFVSCNNEGTQTIGNENSGIRGPIKCKKFTFENHQYVEFRDCGFYGQGFVHDPDCPTCHPIMKSDSVVAY